MNPKCRRAVALKPAANGRYTITVQIITLLFSTVQKYMYPPVSKVHVSFRVSAIHRTLTWTSGSLACVRDHGMWSIMLPYGIGIMHLY